MRIRNRGHKEVYRGQEYNVDLLPKVKFELIVPSARLEAVLEVILTAARTGKIGDGKIFVFDVDETIRIRNGDRGEAAVQELGTSFQSAATDLALCPTLRWNARCSRLKRSLRHNGHL